MTRSLSHFPQQSNIELAPAGVEWVVDAFRCDPDRLRDLNLIVCICRDVVSELGLRIVGEPLKHAFPAPGGVTALFMLSESHLACHTYPEYALATFNLYCCRERPAWPWQGKLLVALESDEVCVRSIPRGRS